MKNQKIFVTVLIMFFVASTFLSVADPIKPVSAQVGTNYYVNISANSSYVARGGVLGVALKSNASSPIINVLEPNGTLFTSYSQASNTVQNINLPSNAVYGTWSITATAGTTLATTYFDVIDNSWQPTALPYSKTWENVAYTFFWNGTVKAVEASTGNILNLDLFTLRSLVSVPLSYSSSTGLKIHYNSGNTSIDSVFQFIYTGCKFTVNGTLNQAGNFVFNLPQGNTKAEINNFESGDLHFNYQDLVQSNQVFNVNSSSLTLNLPKTFSFDPVIFSDGFESGNFNAWTTEDGSPTVQSSVVHLGNYAMRASSLGQANAVYDAGSSHSSLDLRAYVYLQTAPDLWDLASVLAFFDGSFNLLPVATIYNQGGNLFWSFYVPSLNNYVTTTVGVSLNTWTCVEIKAQAGSGNGVCTLWINGVEIENYTSETFGNPEYAYVGLQGSVGLTVPVEYLDDAVVNNAYIGPVSYPQSSLIATSGTLANSTVTFSSFWSDSYNNLSKYIFGTNNTGSWVNDSISSFSATPSWANSSKTLTVSIGAKVGYEWWANDSVGNWNNTGIQTLTTSAYYISASNDTHSLLSPLGSIAVCYDGFQAFTFSANNGYSIQNVIINGSTQAPLTSPYTFNNLQGNTSIAVSTSSQIYYVNASSDSGCVIYPTGLILVPSGTLASFTCSPYPNYVIYSLIVNGSSIGSQISYSFLPTGNTSLALTSQAVIVINPVTGNNGFPTVTQTPASTIQPATTGLSDEPELPATNLFFVIGVVLIAVVTALVMFSKKAQKTVNQGIGDWTK